VDTILPLLSTKYKRYKQTMTVHETTLKDKSGVSHVYMRGTYQAVIDRIITYPTDDVPLFVEERSRDSEYWVHFVLM